MIHEFRVMLGSFPADCLECWRDACTTTEDVDQNFIGDCCNCVNGACVSQIAEAQNSLGQCCTEAFGNIHSLISAPQSESGSDICSPDNYPFTEPGDIDPIPPDNVVTLPPGSYVVPSFQFDCTGCVDTVIVQGKIDGYSYIKDNPIPINITMNFMIWSQFVDNSEEEDDSLYRLSRSVSMTVTEDNIEPENAAVQQLSIEFSAINELCFNKNEVFGFSFGNESGLRVILSAEAEDGGSTITLSSSSDTTCPELNDFQTVYSSIADRPPLMAILTSKCLIYMSVHAYMALICTHPGPPQVSPSTSLHPSSVDTIPTTASIDSPSSSSEIESTSSSTLMPTSSQPPVVVTADTKFSGPPVLLIAASSGSAAIVLLITVGIIVTLFIVIGSGRVTNNLQQGDVAVASNQAYGVLGHKDYELEATHGNEQENENETYDSIASGRVTTNLQQREVAVAAPNQAYGVLGHQENENETYDSVGSGRVATNLQQGEVAVASNQAYGVLGHQENENETYDSVGSGRVATNLQQGEVAVASNQAYGVFET